MLPALKPQSQSQVIATIGEFFEAGGFLMWPILGCSVVVLGLTIERYLMLRKGRVVPTVVGQAVEQICQGRTDVVAAPIAEAQAPAARVLAAGLRRRGLPVADVEKAMEDQAAKEAMRLRANVRGVSLMAAVAPLLGLLGTVLGIAEAFGDVEQSGLGKPETLAAGIKVALYTTIFGLFVAIPATLIAAHLQGRVRKLLLAISETVAPAIEAIAGRPPVAVTPRASGAEEAGHAA
ncbi:MAG: MotA/TolQ/ExbB proton channel family protein [Planctomycetes bacterium]|nr:MotA/TolQ/ExbB proton channel family protein [Planctomycetota bacterium]